MNSKAAGLAHNKIEILEDSGNKFYDLKEYDKAEEAYLGVLKNDPLQLLY